MNKQFKAILFSLAGLAVLGGVILALHLSQPDVTPPPDNTSTGTPDTEKIPTIFADFDVEAIISIGIVNENDDGYTLVPMKDQNGDGNVEFSVAQLDERIAGTGGSIPYEQQMLWSAAFAVSGLSSVSTVEEDADDLAKYGLSDDTARAKVRVEFKDAGSDDDEGEDFYSFYLGGTLPTSAWESAEVYFRLEGSRDVYAVSAYTAGLFLNSRHDWIETSAFPDYDVEEPPVIEGLTLERVGLDVPIVLEFIPEQPLGEEFVTFNTHRMTSPVTVEVNPEKAFNTLYGIFGLDAAGVEMVAPDSEDYEFYGLAEPSCTVRVTLDSGQTHTLTLGSNMQTEEGVTVGWYGVSSHHPDILFWFASGTLPWLGVTPESLIAEMFQAPYIYSLERLVLSSGEHTLDFSIIGSEEENTILLNGAQLTPIQSQTFGELYQFLIGIKADSLFYPDQDEVSQPEQLIAKTTFFYRDSSRQPDLIEYYAAPNRRSVVRVNGVDMYKCMEAYSSRLVANIAAFASGGEIVGNF